MNMVVSLILRRMRAPLVVLLAAYSISILGLVLIPGVDGEGRLHRMDFFHAFYFVSYMATTIGFGELPHGFTVAQRAWTLVSIYLSVIAWLYAIGKILTLIQDPALKQALTENVFARSARRLAEPFFIVCGYGDTGSLLVRALAKTGIRAVVVEVARERINELQLQELGIHVPGLCADASLSEPLKAAGLLHPHCAGVVALTNSDHANLTIAITTKLLNPGLKVICRAETHDSEANMASFGTDHIINPFDTFGDRLALALHSPGHHLIYEWLTGVPGAPLAQPLYPPHGTWVLCGYGRFGKAVYASLQQEGVPTVIVELDPEGTDCVGMGIEGRGTEANTLLAAGIEEAAGIVAGTDDDANNLSIVMTAHDLQPGLFMVARQNKRDNDAIFEAARLDLVMQRSEIIARNILALLTTPLLPDFLRLMRSYSNEWANQLASRLIAVTEETVPEIWTVELTEEKAPAVAQALAEGKVVHLEELHRDPRDREQKLPCLALLLMREGEEFLVPKPDLVLHPGDQVLYCGQPSAARDIRWILQNRNVLRYVQTGGTRPDGVLWRWLAQRGAGIE